MEPSTFFTLILKKLFGPRNPRLNTVRGFTLIEMITVLAIITVITGITLVSQSTFNRSIILTDTAYTVALSIRETQSIGLSSKTFGNVTNAGYGVHFDAGTPASYQEFADVYTSPNGVNTSICPHHLVSDGSNPDYKPGDCIYESGQHQTEDVQKFAFSRGYTIKSFCVYKHVNNAIATAYCSNPNSGLVVPNGVTIQTDLSTLDILFERPDVDTVMTANVNGTYLGNAEGDFDTACVEITPPGNQYFRYIQVNELGEVLVTNACT